MKKDKESGIFIVLLFLLLPYLLTVIIQGREECPINREIPLEEYTAAVAASEIAWDYPRETVKAQIIIARNQLYLKQKAGKEQELIEKAAENLRQKEMNDRELEQFRVFQEAADETKGQLLKLNDEIKELPYHALSQGKTRDGKEVLGENFAYIPSVETPKDIDSPLYIEGCYFSLEDMEKRIKKQYGGFSLGEDKIIEIKSADALGYVMEIQIGNLEFQGEQVKEMLGLPSACFTVQRLENQVRFLCRGIGHGIGLSQYTAKQMALEGKSYRDILKYFFPEMEIRE